MPWLSQQCIFPQVGALASFSRVAFSTAYLPQVGALAFPAGWLSQQGNPPGGCPVLSTALPSVKGELRWGALGMRYRGWQRA